MASIADTRDGGMVEDAWLFDDDIVLDCKLTANDVKHKLCDAKTKQVYLDGIYKRKPHCNYPWSRTETNCLYQKLDNGDYNLSRIKRMNALLKDIPLLEIHDRALVLLTLRYCLFLDPVGFLHSGLPRDHTFSLKSWLVKTKAYRDHYYSYHGFNGSATNAPNALKKAFRHRVMKAMKIVDRYNDQYFEGSGNFNIVFNDITWIDMRTSLV